MTVSDLTARLERIERQLAKMADQVNTIQAAHIPFNLPKKPSVNPKKISEIIEAVAAEFEIHPRDMLVKTNAAWVAQPRFLAMYLSRKLTLSSLPGIGIAFGGFHHTTVLHAIVKAESRIATDETFRRHATRVQYALADAAQKGSPDGLRKAAVSA